MKVGDDVYVPVVGNPSAHGQVIDIVGDVVVVAGDEEKRRADEAGRAPVGVGFKKNVVKENNLAKKA